MAQLTIQWKHIALFINRPNGGTALMPLTGHSPTITDDKGVDLTGTLGRGPVVLRKNGARIDVAPQRPASTPLIHLDSITTEKAQSRPNTVLDGLALRWELGAGVFIAGDAEATPGYEFWATYPWHFGSGWQQQLTNRVNFVLPLTAGAAYDFADEAGNRLYPLDHDTTLLIENTDDDGGAAATADFNTTGELTDFGLIYDLVQTAQRTGIIGPLPSATSQTTAFFAARGFRGRDRARIDTFAAAPFPCEKPFCPGAQCDGLNR